MNNGILEHCKNELATERLRLFLMIAWVLLPAGICLLTICLAGA